MYAIIETGGKQYRVTPGDVVTLERLEGKVGETLTLDKVLFVGGKADAQPLIGTPYLPQAALQVEIVEQSRGEKLLTIKYRRRKGYRRTIGHRQEQTRVLITKLEDGRGQSLQFDSAKRKEALMKASVSQKPAAEKPAKKAASAAAPKTAKATTEKKAATATKKTASKKKA